VTSIESDTTGSSQIRWRDTVAAARFVVEHPIIGAGIGMDILALNTVRGEEWMMVHNVYFQYAVDLGLPGIGLFVLLLYGVYRAASTSRKRLADQPARRDLFLLAEALEISLIVFALSGPFYPVAYHFYFYYMAGLALAARAVTNDVLARPAA
jgi:putative inorganic carbon (hco3(-)) transporter